MSSDFLIQSGNLFVNESVSVGGDKYTQTPTRITIHTETCDSSSRALNVINASGKTCISVDANGRIDQRGRGTDGGIHVLRINPPTPFNNQRAGHYAFGAVDSSGQEHTITRFHSYMTNIDPTGLESKVVLDFMSGVISTGNYSFPNKAIVIDRNGFILPGIPLRDESGKLRLSTNQGVLSVRNYYNDNVGGVFQCLAGDSCFGNEQNVPSNLRFIRDNKTIGGITSANHIFSLYGGNTSFKNHLSIAPNGNTIIGPNLQKEKSKLFIEQESLTGDYAVAHFSQKNNNKSVLSFECAEISSSGPIMDYASGLNITKMIKCELKTDSRVLTGYLPFFS